MTTKSNVKKAVVKTSVKKAVVKTSVKKAVVKTSVKKAVTKKVGKRIELVITGHMEKAIKEGKQMIKDQFSKADTAREIIGMLKGHERRQIIHCFIEGAGLTKAGANTYYFNLTKKK